MRMKSAKGSILLRGRITTMAVLALCAAPGHAGNLGFVTYSKDVTGKDGNPYIEVGHTDSLVQDPAKSPHFPHMGKISSLPAYIPKPTDAEAYSRLMDRLKEAKDCQCLRLVPLTGDGDCRIVTACSVRLDTYSLDPFGNLGNITSSRLAKGADNRQYIEVDHSDHVLQESDSSAIPNYTRHWYNPVLLPKPVDELTFISIWALIRKAQECQCIQLIPLNGVKVPGQQTRPDTLIIKEYSFKSRW